MEKKREPSSDAACPSGFSRLDPGWAWSGPRPCSSRSSVTSGFFCSVGESSLSSEISKLLISSEVKAERFADIIEEVDSSQKIHFDSPPPLTLNRENQKFGV